MKDRAPSPRPVVGVTGPDHGGWPAWIFTRWALRRVGARPIRITPSRRCDPLRLDGLVVGGGADVTEPLKPGPTEPAPPRSRLYWPRRALDVLLAPIVLVVRIVAGTRRRHGIDLRRDALELELLREGRRRDIPVLGICRGAQLMSLAEGGTLLRDVDTMYDERPQLYTVLPRREVLVGPTTRLREILGVEALLVNSLHFHAVDQPGERMQVAAREPSGVPQAVEHADRRFWIGVQWHPEYLPQHEVHQKLFSALTDAAREVAERRLRDPSASASSLPNREESLP